MSAENFQMSNPNDLMQGGISTVQIPFRDIGNIKRGSGPVKDMCYVLLERDYEISHDDAVPHPTEANPEDYKGWKIIGKGVFKGWKDWNKDDEDEVNFRDKFGINIEHGAYNEQRNIWNPKLIDEKTKKEIEIGKDKVRFVRNYRAVYYPNDNETVKYYSPTNKITNNLYWKQCMHDITREQADVGRAKMNELGDWDDKLTHDMKGLVGSLLGGAKDGGYKRKKKRKRRKSKKRKTRGRKRKTRRRKRKTRRRKRKTRRRKK